MTKFVPGDLIEKRVDKMFEEGAVSEVKRFIRLKIKKSNSVNKVIGIEEILKYLNKEINLEQTKEKIYIKSRQYAKRQSTWARGNMLSWQKVDPRYLASTLKKFK